MPLVELADGSTVQFLAPGASGAFEAQGSLTDNVRVKLTEISRRTGQVLLEAVNGVKGSLSPVSPSELEIEVAVSLSETGSLIFASGSVEGSFTIKAVWKS